MALTRLGTNAITALPAIDGSTLTGLAKEIGDGQTWSNETSNRSANTTYTNSTGQAIQIVIGVYFRHTNGNLGGNPTLTIDSTQLNHMWTTASGGTQNEFPFIAIVPAGSTYELEFTDSNASLQRWLELS